jgi:hypothetical protein
MNNEEIKSKIEFLDKRMDVQVKHMAYNSEKLYDADIKMAGLLIINIVIIIIMFVQNYII